MLVISFSGRDSLPPVKSIFFTRRSSTRTLPTVRPSPGRTERTPSGTPASLARSANSRSVRGVNL